MSKQRKSASEVSRRPSKVRPVPINQMRTPPALVTQRRFRQAHGDALAANLDLNKLGLPVVNHRDGIYWLCDGQHRVYALRQNGFKDELLDCQVFNDLTDSEMADVFLGLDDRKPVGTFDKFHIACTAGHVRELDIQRTVETQGLKISQTKSDDSVSAIGAMGKVYDLSGSVVLGQTLRSIKAGFAGDPHAFDAAVIEGVGLVFNRYNGRTNERELASRLSESANGVRGLLRRAEAQRQRTGNQKSQCVAATVVDLYNKGLERAKRLPSWWKEAAE
jgi:hypothetical protein